MEPDDDYRRLLESTVRAEERLHHFETRLDKHGARIDDAHETTQVLLLDARTNSEVLGSLWKEIKRGQAERDALEKSKASSYRVTRLEVVYAILTAVTIAAVIWSLGLRG